MRKLVNKKIAAVAAGAIVVASAGAAYAYWTTTGGGTGDAATAAGDVEALEVTGDVPDDMFPGDDEQTIEATVENTGAANAYVSSLAAYLTIVPAVTGADCEADDFLIDGLPATGDEDSPQELTWTPTDLAEANAAGDDPESVETTEYTIQFNNEAAEDQDGCKDAAVTVNYVAG